MGNFRNASSPLVSDSERIVERIIRLLEFISIMHSRTLSYSFWIAGGVISLLITMWGCFASTMFDLGNFGDLSLALCFVLPLPCFLIGFYSKRWSAALLWVVFVALWWNRAHIRPNPEWNPLDQLETMYLMPAVAVQLAILCAPKKNLSLP